MIEIQNSQILCKQSSDHLCSQFESEKKIRFRSKFNISNTKKSLPKLKKNLQQEKST